MQFSIVDSKSTRGHQFQLVMSVMSYVLSELHKLACHFGRYFLGFHHIPGQTSVAYLIQNSIKKFCYNSPRCCTPKTYSVSSLSTGHEPHQLLWHHPWSAVCIIHCAILWISHGSSGVGFTKGQRDGWTSTDAERLLDFSRCPDRGTASNQIVLQIH